jgi:XRE family transcriptional regulator, fatty acid utilization regulator
VGLQKGADYSAKLELQMRTHRIFAGERIRLIRKRYGYNQTALAERIGLSVSYLSQIETNDRPLTDAVLIALTREFPRDWADFDVTTPMALMADLAVAMRDAGGNSSLPANELSRLVDQQPLIARHIIATHAELRRTQEQLRSLDDAFDSGSATPLPWEEVRDWFNAEGNYIDAVDRAAEHVAHQLGIPEDDQESAIQECLKNRYGVTLEISPNIGANGPLRSFNPETRKLTIDSAQPSESKLFQLAHQLMKLELADTIASTIDDAHLRTPETLQLLTVGLANYAAGALLMPYDRFREAARVLRHDIDELSHLFGVSFEQTCHRLSTLQRSGTTGIPFFFCRVDMAGNITKRHSATRLQFARTGGACPLWIMHEAVAIPDKILTQLAETPDGARYAVMAKGLVKPSGSYSKPNRRYAVALGCDIDNIETFVYADRLAADRKGGATPIGTSCRVCSRENCEQRAFPPVGLQLVVNPDYRSIVPYSFG